MEGPDLGTLGLLLGIAVAAAVFGGKLAGHLGVGGGIVIVPALYLALSAAELADGVAMQVAVATSLAIIVFTEWSSSRGHHQRGAVDVALLRRWAPWVVLGVVGGSLLGAVVDGRVMVAAFGVVASLVASLVAINMLLGSGSPQPEPRQAPTAARAATGDLTGGVSALMGIGGGTVCVPVLSYLGYDVRRAVGTLAALGLVIGLPATLVYIATGLAAEDLPPYSLGYMNLAVITSFTTNFAKVGARFAHAIPMRALRMSFGLFLAVTAARMSFDLATAA